MASPLAEDQRASLIDSVRVALRVSSKQLDPEVETLVDAAIEDMQRVGVSDAYIASMPALVRQAVICYAKSGFGFDNEEAPRFQSTYRQMVADMMNYRSKTAEEPA